MTQSPLMLYLKAHNCHIHSDGVGMADGLGCFEVDDMGGWGYGSGYGEGGFGSRGDWVDPDFYRERQSRGVLGIAMDPIKAFALACGGDQPRSEMRTTRRLLMTDLELATLLIARLNKLLENPHIRKDITQLLETRVSVSLDTVNHPTIQVTDVGLGFLGLLNGIVGIIPEGRRMEGWGYISAFYGDDGIITHFCLTSP